MKLAIRSVGVVLAFVALAACDKIAPTAPPVRETVKVSIQQSDMQFPLGSQLAVFVTTVIVGRDMATFADTTVITLDSKIATAKRTAWNQNYGFDDIAGQSYVQVTELYMVNGVAAGTALFKARSVNDENAIGTTLIRVFPGPTKG